MLGDWMAEENYSDQEGWTLGARGSIWFGEIRSHNEAKRRQAQSVGSYASENTASPSANPLVAFAALPIETPSKTNVARPNTRPPISAQTPATKRKKIVTNLQSKAEARKGALDVLIDSSGRKYIKCNRLGDGSSEGPVRTAWDIWFPLNKLLDKAIGVENPSKVTRMRFTLSKPSFLFMLQVPRANAEQTKFSSLSCRPLTLMLSKPSFLLYVAGSQH